MNMGIGGGDGVENVLWQVISLPLPSSVRNILVQCETNVDVGTIFRRKSNTVNIITYGLIPHDECWSISRLFISRVNDILKQE